MSNQRLADLAAGLADVEQRIAQACADAGRARDDVTLIAVTKTYPASDVDALASLGVRDVGENRHPEAGDKAAESTADVRWHFLGGLQTNKAGQVARYADVVHSVDRPKLVASLSRGAVAAQRTITCLVQVDFDATNPGRSGVVPGDVMALAEQVATADHLRLGGLMTVAPLGVDPRPVFDQMAVLSATLTASFPEATWISAGMSGDFEHAISAGATHLRIGRSILGARDANR